jgi:hypothetical protein
MPMQVIELGLEIKSRKALSSFQSLFATFDKAVCLFSYIKHHVKSGSKLQEENPSLYHFPAGATSVRITI